MNIRQEPKRDAPDSQLGKLLACGIGLAGLVLLLLASGCSSVEMKGTPFYSGEYSKHQGPVEQRVNVWPLFYYRDPALSLFWPVFELTDDHLAVRPLFSVYGLDQSDQQYNVLWPLSQFDLLSNHNHIFPLFWGDDYYALFPLYWHFGHPWEPQGGSDSLFPLWVLSRHEPDRFSFYSPWPLVHFWSDQKESHAGGSMILPLYWQKHDDRSSQFCSPLWLSQNMDNGDYWRALLPLYYQMQKGDQSAFLTPLWSQGHNESGDWRAMFPFWFHNGDGLGGFDFSCPWPLLRFWSDGNSRDHGSRVLPLYWHELADGASQFVSLLWSSGRNTGGYWRFLTPLFYQSSNELNSTLLTPLWEQGHQGNSEWNAQIPLWYRSHEGTNRSSVHFPLGHIWSDAQADDSGSTLIPFYWHDYQKGNSRFYSALWLSETDRNGDSWRLLPPLFYQESDQSHSMFLTPVWAQGKTETNNWTCLVPLCYWDRQQHELLSPLWAHWRDKDKETWLLPWTLSWQTRTPERSDLTLAGGLAHASWGLKPGPDYLFPLFYNDPTGGTQLSPLWFRWRDEDSDTTFVPGLLSWKTRTAKRSDLWMAGGLARASWGAEAGADYFCPLFYHDTTRLLTPLLGWDHGLDDFYYATPLAGAHTGQRAGSWLFPLYSHSRVRRSGDVKDNFLLLGGHTKNKQSSRSWFIPFYYYQNGFLPTGLEDGKSFNTYGKNFWCLPICWYRNQCYLRPVLKSEAQPDLPKLAASSGTNTALTISGSRTNSPVVRDCIRSEGIFPLWSYSAQSTPAEHRSNRDASVLLWLYDYKHQSGPLPGTASGTTNDYTRSRVLWRLWHFEKSNGDVSVDVFPSFTYDRKPDGFKKLSFLWRFFRYEREPKGDRKLDLLFIPLLR